MATTHPLPSAAPANQPVLNSGDETGESRALVPVSATDLPARDPAIFSAPIALLPVELDVTVPVREFRVRNLLALEPGQLIESQWGHGDDVPLAAGEVQLAWTEFEVIETQLAVRVTRLA
jgi:flagellar motor switch/type III secretory pathway protein FliN